MTKHLGFFACLFLLVLTFGTLCYVRQRELGLQRDLRTALYERDGFDDAARYYAKKLETEQDQVEAVRGTADYFERLYRELKADVVEYVDEANIRGEFKGTEELGKAYPRIIIDGVKCDYDPDQKWFVHADLRCRVMWMGIGDGKILMDRVDFRGHEGEPYENPDGDIIVEMHPLKIMEKGKWRTLKIGDPIHKYAATYLGLQKSKDETPERDTVSRLGNTDYWAEFDGESWKLADTSKFPDDVKAGLPGGRAIPPPLPPVPREFQPSATSFYDESKQQFFKILPDGVERPWDEATDGPTPMPPPSSVNVNVRVSSGKAPRPLVAITHDVIDPKAKQTELRLASVRAEYEEALSHAIAIDREVSAKSKELAAILKEQKRANSNLRTLQEAIATLTVEAEKAPETTHEPPPQLGGYSPDENGTSAYLRDLDAWEKRNPVKQGTKAEPAE